MNAAIPGAFLVSPCKGVELPRKPDVRPLVWTGPRVKAYLDDRDRRLSEAEHAKGTKLTTVEQHGTWKKPDLRPCPVMVWTPRHSSEFLESIAEERLFAMFNLTMFCGLRRDEVLGLGWPEVDFDEELVCVRETGGGDGPKSNAGIRLVPMPDRVSRPLRAWRAAQNGENLAWGPAWTDTGKVFTREDGRALTGQWVSVRFSWLAWKAELPPVRFHDLRHGAASLLKAAGYDDKYISEILGHSRPGFTAKQYIHLFPEFARDAVNAAAAVVPLTSREAR